MYRPPAWPGAVAAQAGRGLIVADRLARLWYGRSVWRWALWPLSLLFRAVASVRRRLYRSGLLAVPPAPVPVVVVGNLSVGGAGKTPLTVWLADELRRRGVAVGVVSRGYRGRVHAVPHRVQPDRDTAAEVGDEPLLIARRTGVPVAVCVDRPAAVAALAADGVQLVLSDDGLQHYRLQRAAEVAVVDGTRGLGNGLCLPAGPLREPSSRLTEVDAVVVNGGDGAVLASLPGLRRPAWQMTLVAARAVPLAGGEPQPLAAFAGCAVHAVAGIAHPQRFFETLQRAGIEVIPHPLPDHARLTEAMLRFGDRQPVLMTEKDMVRCTGFDLRNHWYVPVTAEVRGDGDLIDCLLARAGLEPPARPVRS